MGRVTIVGCAAAVALGLLSGCGNAANGTGTAPGANPSSRPAAPAPAGPTVRTISVTVRGGKVGGDTGRVAVPLGTPIVLAVSSDVADEIHVHGYDLKKNVPAGGTSALTFTASKPGVWDVELEKAKLTLLQLQVS